MKLRNILIGTIVGLALFGFAVADKVQANEGVFELGSVADSGSSCYVLSVFESGRYMVTGTCRDLKTPFSADLNRYVLWSTNSDDETFRVGEVKYGKIDGTVSDKFVTLMVTAEAKGSPRKPGESVVARGSWKAIPLVGEAQNIVVTPTPTPEVQKEAAVTTETTERSGIAKFLSAVGRVIGIGFLLLLVGVVVMTIITRRKEQA